MRLHKEAFAATTQTKVESHTKNIDPLLLIKLTELEKSLSPALVEEIIKQHIVSTTGTESQMTVKYLKDVSTKLAIASAVREGGLKRHFSAE